MSDLLWDESPRVQQYANPLAGGVLAVRCACCATTWIIINRRAYDGDLQFCRACLALPEATAEAMILGTEATLLFAPATHLDFYPW